MRPQYGSEPYLRVTRPPSKSTPFRGINTCYAITFMLIFIIGFINDRVMYTCCCFWGRDLLFCRRWYRSTPIRHQPHSNPHSHFFSNIRNLYLLISLMQQTHIPFYISHLKQLRSNNRSILTYIVDNISCLFIYLFFQITARINSYNTNIINQISPFLFRSHSRIFNRYFISGCCIVM